MSKTSNEDYGTPSGSPVNPPHYRQGEIECIDAIEAALGPDGFKAFLTGQVMKYLWRQNLKGNQVLDLQKANWYLNKLIERANAS